jgi:Pilus assembly protein, PilO
VTLARRELAILVAVAVLVTAAAYAALIRPKEDAAAAARADARRAADQGQTLRTEIQALGDVRSDAAALKRRAKTAGSLFPDGPDLPDLVDALQKVADRSGVDLLSIQPSAPAASAESPLLASIGTAVSVQGGYFQIEDFLARVEGLVDGPDPGAGIPPRSVLVKSVDISGAGAAAGQGTAGAAPAGGSTGSDRLTANIGLVVFQSAGSPATRSATSPAAQSATQRR